MIYGRDPTGPPRVTLWDVPQIVGVSLYALVIGLAAWSFLRAFVPHP